MAGYSGTPLVKKLGVKENSTMYVYDAPKNYFDWLSPLPKGADVKSRATGEMDFIHVFATRLEVFKKQFLEGKKHLKKNGMLWISWPKKASKIDTDLDENIIRDFGLANGLVDVKVCAVDEVWSGLKFVVRTKDRQPVKTP
ncbi:MAG TPA: DUF3052 domain-containing protein [Chryseolinea sp.]